LFSNEVYAIYKEANISKIKLNLKNTNKEFSVQWYNPRTGGDLQNGSITSIKGTGFVSLGNPPTENSKDWLLLIKKKN
jgi:hypothetical protein